MKVSTPPPGAQKNLFHRGRFFGILYQTSPIHFIIKDVIYVWHFLYCILLIKTMVMLLVQNVRILLYCTRLVHTFHHEVSSYAPGILHNLLWNAVQIYF